jgi:hypothetical protein
MRRLFRTVLPAAAIGLLLTNPASAEAVVNGGFETAGADPTDAVGWTQLEIAGAGDNGATANTDRTLVNPRTGTSAMLLEVSGSPLFGPVAEIQQLTTPGSVTAGELYDFELFATGVLGPGAVGSYAVQWFQDGVGPIGFASQGNYAVGPTYTQTLVEDLLAPSGADSVLIQVRMVTGAFTGAAGNATVDDVSFALVPEPASLTLLGLGTLGLIGRRRRG